MEQDLTLVILAAGMGSRFGGLKQIEKMGPSGEFIIDYSIYDAIGAGFTKVVFLIKEEHYDLFKTTIGTRIEKQIKVEYAFQKNDNLPIQNKQLIERDKPLGTAHALLCCKDKLNGPFAMINSDDFYGKDSYIQAAKFLKEQFLRSLNNPFIPFSELYCFAFGFDILYL
jgi:choline kinase